MMFGRLTQCEPRRASLAFASLTMSSSLRTPGEQSTDAGECPIQRRGSKRLEPCFYFRAQVVRDTGELRGPRDTLLFWEWWKPHLVLQDRLRLHSLPPDTQAFALSRKGLPSRRGPEVCSEKTRMNAARVDLKRWKLVGDE